MQSDPNKIMAVFYYLTSAMVGKILKNNYQVGLPIIYLNKILILNINIQQE